MWYEKKEEISYAYSHRKTLGRAELQNCRENKFNKMQMMFICIKCSGNEKQNHNTNRLILFTFLLFSYDLIINGYRNARAKPRCYGLLCE